MVKRLLSSKNFFPLAVITVLILLFITAVSLSQEKSLNDSLQSEQEAKLTEQLWNLVRTIRQERSAYCKRQSERTQKIEETRNISKTLQSRLDELRVREEQLDEELNKIKSDIGRLKQQVKKNESMQSFLIEHLDKFVTVETVNIENRIPYRRIDRLVRLRGLDEDGKEKLVSDILGRVWNFSQEEIRIAGSGETFTNEISLGSDRRQNVRLFRVGHQILGYVTEDGTQTGIWLKQEEGAGWRHNLEGVGAEAVRKAVDILDRRISPEYVGLPIVIELVNLTKQEMRDKKQSE
jgi:hypothetical protein